MLTHLSRVNITSGFLFILIDAFGSRDPNMSITSENQRSSYRKIEEVSLSPFNQIVGYLDQNSLSKLTIFHRTGMETDKALRVSSLNFCLKIFINFKPVQITYTDKIPDT